MAQTPPSEQGNAAIGCAIILALLVLVPAGLLLALYLAVGFALGPLWFTLWVVS